MKIVIDIPAEDFEKVRWGKGAVSMMRKVIIHGTPLPKGHGDLIDKGKFKKWIETQDGDKLMTEYYLDALDMQESIVGGSHDEDID